MVKRSPPPSADDIEAAFRAAMAGKGRRLAQMVKAFSLEDLASAFSHVAPRQPVSLIGLGNVLAFAAGRKEERARMAEFGRTLRQARRAKL